MVHRRPNWNLLPLELFWITQSKYSNSSRHLLCPKWVIIIIIGPPELIVSYRKRARVSYPASLSPPPSNRSLRACSTTVMEWLCLTGASPWKQRGVVRIRRRSWPRTLPVLPRRITAAMRNKRNKNCSLRMAAAVQTQQVVVEAYLVGTPWQSPSNSNTSSSRATHPINIRTVSVAAGTGDPHTTTNNNSKWATA